MGDIESPQPVRVLVGLHLLLLGHVEERIGAPMGRRMGHSGIVGPPPGRRLSPDGGRSLSLREPRLRAVPGGGGGAQRRGLGAAARGAAGGGAGRLRAGSGAAAAGRCAPSDGLHAGGAGAAYGHGARLVGAGRVVGHGGRATSARPRVSQPTVARLNVGRAP